MYLPFSEPSITCRVEESREKLQQELQALQKQEPSELELSRVELERAELKHSIGKQ